MNRQDITYQDKLNELRLDLSHPNSFGINFVFVEGESDIKLFRKLFDLAQCKVESIPGGSLKLEECVESLVDNYPLVIGIRDADFFNLNLITDIPINIFLTDCHDMEMSLLSENSVLNSLFFEFTSIDELDHNDIFIRILQTIEKIHLLKWLNSRENLELTFSKVGFQDLVSFDDFSLNFEEYFRRVLSKSANARARNYNYIDEQVNILKEEDPDIYQLANGHDALNILSCYFNNECGYRGICETDLSRALRMVYSFEKFQRTNLYNQLRHWENSNNTQLFRV